MDRRSFSKLLAGAVTTAGMHGVNAAESKPALQKISISDDRPNGGSNSWELVILDAAPPYSTEAGATGAAGIDGALLWYRPSTSERGIVARGRFNVGLALEDVDRDGHKEIIVGKNFNGT